MGPTGKTGIVQLHLTRRCNLRCIHCYSDSSPQQSESLDLPIISSLLDEMTQEGYHAISLSGGEPLIDSRVFDVLREARHRNLNTAMVTNGLLINPPRADQLAELCDLVAISFDGLEKTHDRIRARPGSFHQTLKRLSLLRERGVLFGIVFTLTQNNLHELEPIARLAIESGAQLLQVHPLESIGRATYSETTPLQPPDALERTLAMLEIERLRQEFRKDLIIQIDLVPRDAFENSRPQLLADEKDPSPEAPLSTWFSPLVVESDACVLPLEHGLDRRWQLGILKSSSLRTLAARWKQDLGPSFRALCRRVFDDCRRQENSPVVNWYHEIEVASRELAQPQLA